MDRIKLQQEFNKTVLTRHCRGNAIKNTRQQRGFTLLEVLIAMVILSTALTAIFMALRTCTIAARHGRMLTQAVLLAETKLTEFMLTDNPAYETQTGVSGTFGWLVRTTPTEIENLAAVEVIISWNEQQRPQQYEMLSLRKMKIFTQTN